MAGSKVFYTDFRAKLGEGLPTKLKRLMHAAGMEQIDMENKFVAIKMHFGEMGNLSFLRPNYAKAVADVFISLTHFKGHETTGFGGAIKNIGMGCGSRAGKKGQHANGQPVISAEDCRGCKRCMRECANQGLVYNESIRKMTVDTVHFLPNIGMFASFDPLALDQACVDACLKATPLPNSQLSDNYQHADFCDHHDHFENTTPNSEYKTCLEHAEKIGLGSREYELIFMK